METFEERHVHKLTLGKGKTGSFADLSQELSQQGFEYQYKPDPDSYPHPSYSQRGYAEYINYKTSVKAILKRVRLGEPARMTGATVGLIRTHATADTWQILKENIEEAITPLSCPRSFSNEHVYDTSQYEQGKLKCELCGLETTVAEARKAHDQKEKGF